MLLAGIKRKELSDSRLPGVKSDSLFEAKLNSGDGMTGAIPEVHLVYSISEEKRKPADMFRIPLPPISAASGGKLRSALFDFHTQTLLDKGKCDQCCTATKHF